MVPQVGASLLLPDFCVAPCCAARMVLRAAAELPRSPGRRLIGASVHGCCVPLSGGLLPALPCLFDAGVRLGRLHVHDDGRALTAGASHRCSPPVSPRSPPQSHSLPAADSVRITLACTHICLHAPLTTYTGLHYTCLHSPLTTHHSPLATCHSPLTAYTGTYHLPLTTAAPPTIACPSDHALLPYDVPLCGSQQRK